MLKPALQLRLGQQLTMTPQLQQAIRLLQLPVLELQAQIREALESNVMLEAEDEAGSLETGERTLSPHSKRPRAERRRPQTRASTEQAERAEGEQPLDIDSRIRTGATRRSPARPRRRGRGDDDHSQDFSDARGETLQEHLTWQLEMSRLERARHAHRRGDHRCHQRRRLRHRAARRDRAQPAAGDRRHDRRGRARARHVQAMDPAGVGARSVSECIELQLRQLDPDTPGRDTALAHRGAVTSIRSPNSSTHCCDGSCASPKRNWSTRSCWCAPASRVRARACIRVPAEYIVPDVFVRRTERGWAVEINPASLPRIRVNQSYAGFIGRSADHAMLRTQLQEARWLIRSLEIRNETLLKVARCIVQRQSAFLEHGDEYMQPMILKDVAEAVQMHESTISRVTTNKYMHTHRGVFEFRYFFSSHVAGERRHRDVLDGHPRQDPQAGRGGGARQAAVRQPHRRDPVAGGRARRTAHRREVPRSARYSAVQRTQASFACR